MPGVLTAISKACKNTKVSNVDNFEFGVVATWSCAESCVGGWRECVVVQGLLDDNIISANGSNVSGVDLNPSASSKPRTHNTSK